MADQLDRLTNSQFQIGQTQLGWFFWCFGHLRKLKMAVSLIMISPILRLAFKRLLHHQTYTACNAAPRKARNNGCTLWLGAATFPFDESSHASG
jgi:hypothetical protein